jgi:hypothetical protein
MLDLGPSPFAGGVDERRERSLGLGRLRERVLSEDGGPAERLDSRFGSASDGIGVATEAYRFGFCELPSTELLAAQTRFPFPPPIEPGSFDRLAGEQGLHAVNPRPILGSGDQILLAAMRQNVDQVPDLGFLLVARMAW